MSGDYHDDLHDGVDEHGDRDEADAVVVEVVGVHLEEGDGEVVEGRGCGDGGRVELVVGPPQEVEAEVARSAELGELAPLDDVGVLVDDLAFAEVERAVRVDGRGLDEGLVEVVRVDHFVLEFEEAVDVVSEELWVAESVGDVGVALLVGRGDVPLEAFVFVEVGVDRPAVDLLLPLAHVAGVCGDLEVEDHVVHEAVLVRHLAEHLGPLVFGGLEAVGGRLRVVLYAFREDVGVQAGRAAQVRPVERFDLQVELFLQLQRALEVVDVVVEAFVRSLQLLLVALRRHVLGRVSVPVGQRGDLLVLHHRGLFDPPHQLAARGVLSVHLGEDVRRLVILRPLQTLRCAALARPEKAPGWASQSASSDSS